MLQASRYHIVFQYFSTLVIHTAVQLDTAHSRSASNDIRTGGVDVSTSSKCSSESTTGTDIWQYIHVTDRVSFHERPFSQLVPQKNTDSWVIMGETEDIS